MILLEMVDKLSLSFSINISVDIHDNLRDKIFVVELSGYENRYYKEYRGCIGQSLKSVIEDAYRDSGLISTC